MIVVEFCFERAVFICEMRKEIDEGAVKFFSQFFEMNIKHAKMVGMAFGSRQNGFYEHFGVRRLVFAALQYFAVIGQNFFVMAVVPPVHIVGANQNEKCGWCAAQDVIQPRQHPHSVITIDTAVLDVHILKELIPAAAVGDAVA